MASLYDQAVDTTSLIVEHAGDVPRSADETVSVGRSGTKNFRGYLTPEEENPKLFPPASFALYDEMWRTDPIVRATLMHLTSPLRAAHWVIESADQTPEALEVAALVRCALFEWMSATTWDQVMQDTLSYMRYGCMVLEEVMQPMTVGWSYEVPNDNPQSLDDTTTIKIAPRQVITWRTLAPRLPRTFTRWFTDVDTEELLGVEQYAYFAQHGYRRVTLPIDKIVYFTYDRIGADYWGTSVLRSAYRPWFLSQNIAKVAAIGLEKWLVGTPMARMNENATATQTTAVLNTLMDLRSGERGAIVYSAKDGLDCQEGESDTNRAVWILQPKINAPDAMPYIRHWQSEIFTNILARFMDLGQREVGARATAEVQDDPFYLALLAHAKVIEDGFNCVIRRMVDLNYPGVTEYPKLKAQRIQPQDIPVIAQAAQYYAANGFLTPDAITEQWVRDQLGMPGRQLTQEQEAAATASMAKPTRPAPPAAGVKPDPEAAQQKADSNADDSASLHDVTLAFTPQRDLRPEEAFCSLGEIAVVIDRARDDFAAAITPALSQVAARLEREAVEALGTGDARRVNAVKAKDLGSLSTSCERALAAVAAYGAEQVRGELQRQHVAGGSSPTVTLANPGEPPKLVTLLAARAQAIAAAIGSALEAAARRSALNALRRGRNMAGDQQVTAAIQREAAGQTTLQAQLAASEAFNLGRDAEAARHASSIEDAVYTSILDKNACEPCLAADNTTTTLASPLYKALDPPNPNCRGEGRCRCMWVYRLNTENADA